MIGGEREVVKLSLGEGHPTLNVLPVGLEGETLTLVCPFPVLPLEMPVRVTLPGEEGVGPVSAVIRRVGVELAGDMELPRFKLQLALDPRKSDEEATAPTETAEAIASAATLRFAELEEPEITDEEYEVEVEPEEDEPAGSDTIEDGVGTDQMDGVGTDQMDGVGTDRMDVSWPIGEWPDPEDLEADELKIEPDELAEPGAIPLVVDDEDPPWVDEDFEIPRDSDEIPPERRTRWPVRLAVTLAFLISILAVGYVMRAPLATALVPVLGEELAASVMSFSISGSPTAEAASSDPLATLAPAAPAEPAEEEPDGEEQAESVAPATEPFESDPAEADDTAIPDEAAPAHEPEGGDEEAAETDGAESAAPDPSVEQDDEYLRVTLPTQWPVTTASSYRLHDPTGIVVDVPGGMASERARWIDTSNERVRSVRVLERDDGVRFIIYLNDEVVPRYRVGYSRSGVTVDIMGPDPRHADEPLVAQVTR